MLLKVVRWILVLPGGILAGIAATFILHFLLYLILSKFYSTYPEFPEKALTPFVVSLAFLLVGTAIAPNYKIATALTLLLIWVAFAVLLATIHFTGMRWFGKEIYFEADGIAIASGIIGTFLGLLLVKDGLRQEPVILSNHEDQEAKSKKLKEQKTQDIYELIFLSLFIISIFNNLCRGIFFGFYLAFILFASWWTVKENLYKTNIQLFTFLKGIFMALCLAAGFIYPKTGVYVSVVCSILCALPFIGRTIREVRESTDIATST